MILRGDFHTIQPIEACAIFHLSHYTQALDDYRTNRFTDIRIAHIGTVAGHMLAVIASTEGLEGHHDFGYRGMGHSDNTLALAHHLGIEDIPRLEIPIFRLHHFDDMCCPELYFSLDENTPRNGRYVDKFTHTARSHHMRVYKARDSI